MRPLNQRRGEAAQAFENVGTNVEHVMGHLEIPGLAIRLIRLADLRLASRYHEIEEFLGPARFVVL